MRVECGFPLVLCLFLFAHCNKTLLLLVTDNVCIGKNGEFR